LLNVLTLGHCSHEFSWPRRARDGHYYQVCLLCAVEYRYDWKTMRRAERIDPTLEVQQVTLLHDSEPQKPTWVPRARRLKLHLPARYRVKSLAAWYEGTVENLSQTGVLLRGPQFLPENTLVELIFEMPEEISGQKNSSVLCQGRIVRSKETGEDGDGPVLAASILDYKFLHQTN
jgi:hypothetical protein